MTGAYFKSVDIGSGESVSRETVRDEGALADGATLSGVVSRDTTSYDVNVEWVDGQGNVAYTESVASGVSSGTETTFDLAARSPQANVVVKDAGSGSGTVTGSAYIG